MGWLDRARARLAYGVLSITSPAFADVLRNGMAPAFEGGLTGALSNPAFYRGVSLVTGTIASLPLRTFRKPAKGDPLRVSSFLEDNPAGPFDITPFSWVELIASYLVTMQECGLLHIEDNAGQIIGFLPVHPNSFGVRWAGVDKEFEVTFGDNTKAVFTQDGVVSGQTSFAGFTQIMGLSFDGLRGMSPLTLFARGITLLQAQEYAATKTMTSGMQASGMVVPKDIAAANDMEAIQKQLNEKVQGPDYAGQVRAVNRMVEFIPWTQSNADAQFIEGRRFSREDVALMLGIPIYKFNPEKQTSWGTGVAEQNAGFARETLMPITSRIESAVSRALRPSTKYIEFDYKGLLQGTPAQEVEMVLKQYDDGIISEEEARGLLGLGPKDPTQKFKQPVAPAPSPNGSAPAMMNGATRE